MVVDRPMKEYGLIEMALLGPDSEKDEHFFDECSFAVDFRRISEYLAARLLEDGFESAIGHEATAKVLSERLGIEIPARRVDVALSRGDQAMLALLEVPRLTEGEILTVNEVAKLLIEYYLVEVV
jgi:hypothetical protein